MRSLAYSARASYMRATAPPHARHSRNGADPVKTRPTLSRTRVGATYAARHPRAPSRHIRRELMQEDSMSLIDLLHLRALIAVLLERREVLDGEAELDHAVDAAREGRRLVEREARGEQRRL